MEQIKKIFLFEWRKLLLNKHLFRILVVTTALLFIALIASFLIIGEESSSPLTKEEQLDSYRDQIQLIDERLSDPLYQRKHDSLKYEKAKLEFLIENNKTELDYFDINEPFQIRSGYYGTSLMNFLFTPFYIFLLIVSFVFGIYTFAFDFDKQSIKNIFSSPIKRENVLYGKMLFQFSIVLSLFIFVLSFSIPGLFNANSEFLRYSNGAFYTTNCLQLFFTQSLGLLILILVILFVMNNIILFSRSAILSAFFPFCILSLLIFAWLIINDLFTQKGDFTTRTDTFIVFINIYQLFIYTSVTTVYWAIGYSVFIVLLALLQKFQFVKLNY